MKAITFKNHILDLREGLAFDIVDDRGQVLTIEGMDDGWRLYTAGSMSIIIHFNNVLSSGDDIYLVKEVDDGDGEQHIFAILDARLWSFSEA